MPELETLALDLRQALEAAPQPCALLAPELRLLWANHAYRAAAGNGLLGEPEAVRRSVARALGAGVADSITLRAPNGQRDALLRLVHSPVRDSRDSKGEAIAVLQQVFGPGEPGDAPSMPDPAAEAALHQAQKMEALGQLTGGIAHDFNNLLQVLSGNLQLLQRAITAPRDRQRLENAIAAVGRGARLASHLLAFARRQPLEPRVLDLGRVLREMDELLRRALGESIELETSIAPDLWNTIADPAMVQSAVLNLAVNARDAMERGRLAISLANAVLDEAYLRQNPDASAGEYVMLAVADSGCGMPPEVVARAFDPFFTTKGEGRGTGLGLSMVHGFVKQSGGHVTLESRPGQGTTVRLYLPRSTEREQNDDPPPEPAEGGGETVLVVEDDAAVRAVVADLLRDLGYRVLEAPDAAQALAVVRNGTPIDVLFTDVVTPGRMGASELVRAVQAAQPEVAVLLTSGYLADALLHGGRLDPGVALLSKPYRREDLARKLRQLLGGRGAKRRAQQDPARPLRVLLVEDDLIIRLDSQRLIRELGHAVVGAASAAAAREALARQEFDVLLTDIGLGRESGVTLAEEARRDHPGLGVVFISGYGSVEGGPPDALLVTKPYGQQQIAAALKTMRARLQRGKGGT